MLHPTSVQGLSRKEIRLVLKGLKITLNMIIGFSAKRYIKKKIEGEKKQKQNINLFPFFLKST